ncbi:MAG: hypothetical protein M4579_001044 [Chaenotheca gracillima]|nr:MAG: hypothetical protein M4579_001044 [Chaenotheca gracillima]
MTPRFIPNRSGVHRVACFALYRALLSQCSRLPVGETERRAVDSYIKLTFRQNSNEHSHRLITIALTAGYEAEKLLRASASGDGSSTSRVLSLLSKLPRPKKRASAQSSSRQYGPQPRPSHTPERYPGADPILARPRLTVPGIRKIPRLVNACNYPLLRIKKPQPRSVSRIIRQKIERKQRWLDAYARLQGNDLREARAEDTWDALVSKAQLLEQGHSETGSNESPSSPLKKDDAKYAHSVTANLEYINSKLRQDTAQKTELARKFLDIIDQERVLAAKEKEERAQARHQRYLERMRLQGGPEGEGQDGPLP